VSLDPPPFDVLFDSPLPFVSSLLQAASPIAEEVPVTTMTRKSLSMFMVLASLHPIRERAPIRCARVVEVTREAPAKKMASSTQPVTVSRVVKWRILVVTSYETRVAS
jgi:hypothetical protein